MELVMGETVADEPIAAIVAPFSADVSEDPIHTRTKSNAPPADTSHPRIHASIRVGL